MYNDLEAVSWWFSKLNTFQEQKKESTSILV